MSKESKAKKPYIFAVRIKKESELIGKSIGTIEGKYNFYKILTVNGIRQDKNYKLEEGDILEVETSEKSDLACYFFGAIAFGAKGLR